MADLELTEDQSALRDSVSALFEKEATPQVVRAAEPLGFDHDLWRRVAALGLPMIGVPSALGGGGGDCLDLAVVAEELGRRIPPVPLIEAAVANDLLATACERSRSGHAAALLERVVGGELLATVALAPAVRRVARLVPAGAVADVVLVLDGGDLLAVPTGGGPGAPGDVPPNLGCVPVADVHTDLGERTVVAAGPVAVELFDDARAQWQALTAVALAGMGARALELGVEYVMQRRAFDVLIGTFQTIQHRLADVATGLEGAWLLGYESAWARARRQPGAAALASMAFLFAAEQAFKAVAESLQFHGGYGYTLEYDIQLYYRRSKAWALAGGDPRREHQRLARLLFETESV